MAEEYWTKYPRDYWWKLFPARWLLSRTFIDMSSAARGAYCCICFELMREKIPGVFENPNDDRFAEWAKIKKGEWIKLKTEVLTAFSVYPDGSIHQETIKEIYEDLCLVTFKKSRGGSSGGRGRGQNSENRDKKGKKSVDESPILIKYRSPYHKWDKDSPLKHTDRYPLGNLSGAKGILSNRDEEKIRESYLLSDAADAPPPKAADAAATVPFQQTMSDLKSQLTAARKAAQS